MRVVTFGEVMIRLAPFDRLRFFQEPKFEATIGGGEANVAVCLSNFGVDCSFVTKLPDNDIGKGVVNQLRFFGLDTTNIVYGGDRVGIYYLEKGASCRSSKVIYDRKYSSISMADIDDFDWNLIFSNCDWFHFSGITPALSDSLAVITEKALVEAKKHNVKVSCDLNYRAKLWSSDKANSVMTKLMKYVDVCIANEEDAEKVFGITCSDNNVQNGKLNTKGYVEVAKKLVEKFDFEKVAITLRESISCDDNKWSAMLFDGKNEVFSKKYDLHIVDRVGGGDSFSAGLIYAILNGYDNEKIINFAVACSALKHTIEGDFNRVSVSEVYSVMKNTSGRVER